MTTMTDTNTTTAARTAAQDWLEAYRQAKDLKKQLEAQEAIKKASIAILKGTIGVAGEVSVKESCDWKTYTLKQYPTTGVSYSSIISDLVARHPELREDADSLKELHTNHGHRYDLKPSKGI